MICWELLPSDQGENGALALLVLGTPTPPAASAVPGLKLISKKGLVNFPETIRHFKYVLGAEGVEGRQPAAASTLSALCSPKHL